MIRIFAMKAAGQNFLADEWKAYLSEERKRESGKYRREKERQLFLGAEVLLNRSLEHIRQNISLPAVYRRNDYGKPCLCDGNGIYVNWSHSGEYVICVLADREAGIDLQYAAEKPKEALVRRLLQPAEWKYYESVPEEKRQKLFYQYWTVKESFLKAVGTGFHTSLSRFYIYMDPVHPKIVQQVDEHPYSCTLLSFREKDYAAAVTYMGGPELSDIEYF